MGTEPTIRDEGGQPVGVSRDITEQKRIEQELQQSEEFLSKPPDPGKLQQAFAALERPRHDAGA